MAGEHPLAALAPRDIVALAITRRLAERGLDYLWLDATGIDDFPARFPTIWQACREAGLHPTREWLPVAPAAHYLCGGVVTDLDGAASLPGLWACGEVSCTGVHGANRLASNSLLEGLVFGHRTGAAIAAGPTEREPTGALRGIPIGAPGPSERSSVVPDTTPERRDVDVAALRDRLQRSLNVNAGVLRDGAGLERAAKDLADVGCEAHAGPDTLAVHELRSLVAVGQALVAAAADREESRGAHYRLDFPALGPAPERIVHLGPGRRIRVPALAERDR